MEKIQYNKLLNKEKDILVGHGAFLKINPNFSIEIFKKAIKKKLKILEKVADGKNSITANDLIEKFFKLLDIWEYHNNKYYNNNKGMRMNIEKLIIWSYKQLELNKKYMNLIFKRFVNTWMLFSTAIISSFCEKKNQYDGEIKEKIMNFKNIFTINYQLNGIKNPIFLHGKYHENNINYSLVLIPETKNKNIIVKSIIEEIDVMIQKKRERLNRFHDIWIKKLGKIPPFYSEETFNNLKKGKDYLINNYEKINSNSKEIVIFGFSPYGDNSLISKIKKHYKKIFIVLYEEEEKQDFINEFSTKKNKIIFINYNEL